MDTKNLEEKIIRLNDSIDKLTLIELCKLNITRDQAREILGSLDNNLYAKVNKIFKNRNKKSEKQNNHI